MDMYLVGGITWIRFWALASASPSPLATTKAAIVRLCNGAVNTRPHELRPTAKCGPGTGPFRPARRMSCT